MKFNYFRAAEEEISSLPQLKRSLELLKRKQQRIVAESAPKVPSAIDYDKPYTNSTYVNNTLNDLLELTQTKLAITATERKMQDIEEILGELSEDQRKVLTMFYIEKLSAEVIAEKMSFEAAKTVYNIRNRAIASYVLLMYGAYPQQI